MRVGTMVAPIALLTAAALAQVAPPTAQPGAVAAPAQETVVEGTVPDLVGNWFAVAHLEIPGGRKRTAPAFWEITRNAEGRLRLDVRFLKLPPAQQEAMDEANKAERVWMPSPADIDGVGSAWDGLAAEDPKLRSIDTTLTGRDAFTETIKAEPRTRDALWVVQQTYNFDASAAPSIRQLFVYGVTAAADGGYTGNFTTTLIAAAPLPLPITFQGTFDLHRLGAPRRGLLERVLAVFRGCGRG